MAAWQRDDESRMRMERHARRIRARAIRKARDRRQEFSVLHDYRRARGIRLDEAIDDALDPGMHEMARSPAGAWQNRSKVWGVLLAFLVASCSGYAFAKSKAPEILSKEWAENIEMRLARAEDNIQENASRIGELD